MEIIHIAEKELKVTPRGVKGRSLVLEKHLFMKWYIPAALNQFSYLSGVLGYRETSISEFIEKVASKNSDNSVSA